MTESARFGSSRGELLVWASRVLALAGLSTPRLDAEVLLAFVLSTTRARLYARWNQDLELRQIEQYAHLVRRREAHEPVAYLVGQRAFYDVELWVDPHVLIPRPETEHILDEALAWVRAQGPGLRVLDVGTGSGALAVVLARHLRDARVWAVDISPEVLTVAARNVHRYDLGSRVLLLCSDLASAFTGTFNLVVANLPYVAHAELDTLPPDVAEYEPRLALDGGEDGLDLVRRLLIQMRGLLDCPGLLLLEIDPRQAETAQELALRAWPDAQVRTIRDYAEWPRVLRVALG
jgi:release factor glutamine methyltransferase